MTEAYKVDFLLFTITPWPAFKHTVQSEWHKLHPIRHFNLDGCIHSKESCNRFNGDFRYCGMKSWLWRKQKDSKTHKRLQERFLIGRKRTKSAHFRGSPLFQATYNIKTETQTINSTYLCQLYARNLLETWHKISWRNCLFVFCIYVVCSLK